MKRKSLTRSRACYIVRRIEVECQVWIRRLERAPRLDDRSRGHLEAMRYLLTVVMNARDLFDVPIPKEASDETDAIPD